MDKTIGIIGGMGPLATVQFLYKLTDITCAEKDQDHVKYILYNNPEIPDRIDAYYKNQESPVNAINNGIKYLENDGVCAIAMPCNTAHIWFKDFIHHVKFLNMIDLTIKKVKEYNYKNIGILATDATIDSGLYTSDLEKYNINVVFPDNENEVMESVHYVKTGNINKAKNNIKNTVNKMINDGCEAIIMACTEIPVIVNNKIFDIQLIDSDQVLAEEIVKISGKKLKQDCDNL